MRPTSVQPPDPIQTSEATAPGASQHGCNSAFVVTNLPGWNRHPGAPSMHVDDRTGIDWRTMDFPPLVSDPNTVPAAAKFRSAHGQVTCQFVGNGLGAFGVSKRHPTKVRQNLAIDQEIKIEARHAGSHREYWPRRKVCARHHAVEKLLKALPPAGNPARAHRPFG